MNEKNKNILLGVLVVGVISMTVAFAALTTRLNLNGTANVAETKWNIHFDNWQPATEGTVNGHQNTAVYPDVEDLNMSDDNNVTLVEGVNITLKQPGDYAKYTFEIVNEGTIAGKLNLFTPTITNNTNNVIGYTVGCYEASTRTGDAIAVNYVLGVNQRVYCDLKVEYKDVTNTQTAGQNQIYQQGEINTTITAEWQWIQDDTNNGGNVTPSNTYVYSNSSEENEDTSNWPTQVNSNWEYYLRKNTSTNNMEACGVFGSGQSSTVCMTSSYYNSDYSSAGNYRSDFENVSGDTSNITTISGLQATGLKGYALAKVEEMLSKGASYCNISSNEVSCKKSSEFGCFINGNGRVYCSPGLGAAAVNNDGSSYCY